MVENKTLKELSDLCVIISPELLQEAKELAAKEEALIQAQKESMWADFEASKKRQHLEKYRR